MARLTGGPCGWHGGHVRPECALKAGRGLALAASKVMRSAPAAFQAELLDSLCFILLELGTGEGVLHFGDLASIANMLLQAAVDLPALGPTTTRNFFAAEAFCTIIGTNPFPLVVVEGIKGQEFQAPAASRSRNTALSESRPVHDLPTQVFQQELGAFGHSSVEEKMREGP